MRKKNVLQLLGIAFVVALAATGIFYGLIAGRLRRANAAPTLQILVAARDLPRGTELTAEDVRRVPWSGSEIPNGVLTDKAQAVSLRVVEAIHAGEPLMEVRLASPKSGKGAGLGIPAGMRAVSVHVTEPQGVVAMLQAGHRVDVQVVSNRAAGGEPAVRTVLDNLEVLAASQRSGSESRQVPVITLLATPEQADILTLADAAASIRLVLRNPLDDGRGKGPVLDLPAVFRAGGIRAPATPAPVRTAPKPAAPPERAAPERLRLNVRVLAARAAALDEFGAPVQPEPYSLPRVDVLRAEDRIADALPRLERDQAVTPLATSDLTARNNRGVGLEVGAERAGLSLQFVAQIAASSVRLRVRPEVRVPAGAGPLMRRVDTEVDAQPAQSILIRGLWHSVESPRFNLVEHLFPERTAPQAMLELVALVTPHWPSPTAGPLSARRE